jgi:hypothetical protein
MIKTRLMTRATSEVSSMDIEEMIENGDEDKLRELKEWLFKENVRLSAEEKELEDNREKFIKEKQDFRFEMNVLTQKATAERQRLHEDSVFFDKKMDILRNGFDELDRDRRQLQDEWDRLNSRKQEFSVPCSNAEMFFIGVDNPVALKKRYRDLIKIYHPDNKAGDHDMFKQISAEYERLRDEFDRKFSVV